MPDPDEETRRSRVEGPIQVDGTFRLAPSVVCAGNVHAPGGVVVGDRSVVEGDVYTDGDVELGEAARILGRVRPAQRWRRADEPTPGRAHEPVARALAAAGDRSLDEAQLDRTLASVAEAYLAADPGRPWAFHLVRDVLFARAIGTLAPVDVDRRDRQAFLVRVRPTPELPGTPGTEAVVRLVQELGHRARPTLALHPLSRADTRGEAVLLAEP